MNVSTLLEVSIVSQYKQTVNMSATLIEILEIVMSTEGHVLAAGKQLIKLEP